MSISASAPGLSKRLAAALKTFDDNGLRDLGARCGVAFVIMARARAGRAINVRDYLALCAGLGIDPTSGSRREDAQVPAEVLWCFLGTGVRTARSTRGLSVRAAARIARIPACTFTRIEQGRPVGIVNFLALCRFVGVPPEGFTRNQCNTLNSREAA